MSSALYVLRIEIDGHWHGGDAPRPWVARIDGVDDRYGLQRDFIQPMNDWRGARTAWSGRTYGIVATFALRSGHLYEVCRLRGNKSRRRLAREFLRVVDGERRPLTPDEALDLVHGIERGATLRVRDSADRPWVVEVTGLGMPQRLGWAVVDGERVYRLRDGGVFEVRDLDRKDRERRRLVGVEHGSIEELTREQAWARLSA